MDKVNYRSELPKWFHISNYNETKKTANNALRQLIVRKILLDLIREKNYEINRWSTIGLSKKYGEDFKIDKEIILKFGYELIQNDPLISNEASNIGKPEEYVWDRLQYDEYKKLESKNDIKPIKNMALKDIGEYFSLLPNKLKNFMQFGELYDYQSEEKFFGDDFCEKRSKYLENLDIDEFIELNSYSAGDFSYFKFSEHPEYNKHNRIPAILVDLSASDVVLEKQFKEWLIQRRKDDALREIITIERRIIKDGSKLVENFYEYRVLAYMDLYIWSLLENRNIKSSVYVMALFENGNRGERFIDKTLQTFVEKLLNPQDKKIAELFALKNLENLKV